MNKNHSLNGNNTRIYLYHLTYTPTQQPLFTHLHDWYDANKKLYSLGNFEQTPA